MKKLLFSAAVFFSAIYSAQHTELFKLKKYRVAVLNDSSQETSGLNFFGDKLYTFNDSGNPAELYEISPTSGKIVQILKVNAENKDWEALASDGENLYIGDFGNNTGTRKDLEIIKIPFQNHTLDNDRQEKISFYFPEQKDFSVQNRATDFDLEAMIFLHGKLHLFTKKWLSKSTDHYIIDATAQMPQAAQKVESYDTGFLVTDAFYYNQKLYIVGYSRKTEVFLMIFNESSPGFFFAEKPRKLYLGNALSVGQVEGIAVDDSGIYLSAEKFYSPVKKTQPFFYHIPHQKL